MPVGELDEAALGLLVGKDGGGGQPLEEDAEAWVRGFEGAELLEELLG